MIARLIKTSADEIQLLCFDGSISIQNSSELCNLLINFKSIKTFSGNDGFWNKEISEMSQIPGETLAIVTDEAELLIKDITVFKDLINPISTKFLSVEEYANLHDRSSEMIKALLRQNRIPGAQKLGKTWIIPSDAPYPSKKREITWTVGRKKQDK